MKDERRDDVVLKESAYENLMPVISIIVPIYNAELYLTRCLESILKQNFSNFEAILIDDGSPDNCGAICDDYAAKDKRFRVMSSPGYN
jgi:glycosyltransferase involved in cell wall biosynthesis